MTGASEGDDGAVAVAGTTQVGGAPNFSASAAQAEVLTRTKAVPSKYARPETMTCPPVGRMLLAKVKQSTWSSRGALQHTHVRTAVLHPTGRETVALGDRAGRRAECRFLATEVTEKPRVSVTLMTFRALAALPFAIHIRDRSDQTGRR